MKEVIAPEGPIMQFFARIWDLVVISIVFVVSCIPVITIGCALTALYYTIVKSIVHQEGHLVRNYFRGFRMNLKQGLILGIICDVLLAVLGGNLAVIVLLGLGNIGVIFGAIFVAILLVALVMMAYCFPILARFEVTLIGLLQTGFQLTLQYAKISFQLLVMEIMLFLGIAAGLFFMPVLLIFWPGMIVYAQSKLLEPILMQYMQKEEEHETEIV